MCLFLGYESEFTRIRSYKHLGPQIDRERFNGVLSKLWSHLWSDQHFPNAVACFSLIVGLVKENLVWNYIYSGISYESEFTRNCSYKGGFCQISNALTGCSTNLDLIFDLINIAIRNQIGCAHHWGGIFWRIIDAEQLFSPIWHVLAPEQTAEWGLTMVPG